jgi:aminoglycoside phosphotransferase (APT) family kinase protein
MSTSAPPARHLTRAALVGRGFCSDVYPWGDGRVLKLFHDRVARAKAEHEYRVTRAVHAAGLPAPAAYDLVEVGGRCGIVFERVDGPSLFEHVQARPWALFDAVRLLAELHARIHNCEATAELPSQREWVAEGIAAGDLAEADKQAALRRLEALPDGGAVCHGDFHPANVLLGPRGPVVIDWDTATRGHPLGDVACTARLIRTAGLPPWAPGYMHMILRGTRPLIHRAYLKQYLRLGSGTRREIDAWMVPLAARASRVPEALN